MLIEFVLAFLIIALKFSSLFGSLGVDYGMY